MNNRLSWLAFPAAAFMGAVLCFLRNPNESTNTPAPHNPSPRATTVLNERTMPTAIEVSTPVEDKDVAQALRSALLHSSDLHRRYELARIAEHVGEQELAVLVQRFLEQPHLSRTDKLVISELWAERAPESAAAFAAKHSETYLLSQGVAKGWGCRDPSAALKWVMSLPAERRLELLTDLQEGSFESGRPNPVDVMQAALQSYDAANQFVRWDDMAMLFTQWARHDASAAEAFARGLASEGQREGALLAIVSALTETAPQKAIDLFEKIPISKQMREGPAANLAARLATQDLALATQFARSQPEGQARASAIASVAKVMLDGHPEQALALIDSVPVADSAGIYSFYKEWIKFDPAHALVHFAQRVEKMDSTSEAYQLVKGYLSYHLKNEAPARESAEFLSGDVNAEWQSRLTDVLERWMRQDSVGAAAWADALPSGAAREYALAGVAKGKTTQSIGQTVEWLATLPKGPDYSAAVQGFAGAVFSKDPDGALAWLKTIPDPAERQQRLLAAWKEWATFNFDKANRTAAEQWRDSSPDLTPEERKGLVVPEAK